MKTSKIPFYLIIGFNIFTLVLYITNPFKETQTINHIFTIIYISLNIYCLSLGYKNGVSKGIRVHNINALTISDVHSINHKYINFYFLFYILTFLLMYTYELHCSPFDIRGLINKIVIGLANSDIGYQSTLTGPQSYRWSIYVLINIIDALFFIVGMLCWKSLSKSQKYLFLILVVLDIIKWFGTGTTFGIVKMTTTFVLVASISLKYSYIPKKKVVQLFVLLLIILIISIVSFSINMEGRAGGELSDNRYGFNENSFIYQVLLSGAPDRLKNIFVYIAYYLIGGYYNLEHVFDCDFHWCYFMGGNNSLMQLAKILGFDISSMNYQAQMIRYGIDPNIQWHTCYLWLANDYSLYGVPIIVYIIGKFMGFAFSIYNRFRDLLSGIVFIVFANTAIYFFANNNYFSGVQYSFFILLPYWYFTRYKTKSK